MLKKLMWKMFPPRYVSLEQVERAHMFFENVRREKNYDTLYHGSYVKAAEKNFFYIVKKRMEYEEYLRSQEEPT